MNIDPFKIAPLLCLLLFVVTSAAAQYKDVTVWENGITERWWVGLNDFSRSDLDRATELWKRIQKENEVGAHHWAGDYSDGGDTHGSYMRWSPRAGFVVAEVNKCEARLMGLTFGSVRTSGILVEFVVEYQKSARSHRHGRPHKPGPLRITFIPIQWSNSQFLVEEGQMPHFGDYVAGLGQFNREFMWLGSNFFTRGSRKAESDYSELPRVPPGYERFIKAPIDGEIIALGSPQLRRVQDAIGQWHQEIHTPVRLNIGSQDGVKRGMFFRVLSPETYEWVKVVRVGSRTARGIIARGLDEDEKDYPRHPQISVGWRLSTSPHKK